MRSKGKITSWNDDRGYGFIAPMDGGKQVFLHVKSLNHRNRRPAVNDIVTYALSRDDKGRPCAADATLAGEKLRKKAPQKSNPFAILFALAFLAAVSASVAADAIPSIVLVVYAALSLVTFLAYALDKSAARSGSWRTSEGTLQLLGLAGGWPGALLAQQTLRHKSKKASFRLVFWSTVLMNCAALVWLHTQDGQDILNSVLAGS